MQISTRKFSKTFQYVDVHVYVYVYVYVYAYALIHAHPWLMDLMDSMSKHYFLYPRQYLIGNELDWILVSSMSKHFKTALAFYFPSLRTVQTQGPPTKMLLSF